ncbi:MAG: hypothetical protein ACI8WB_001724 [Phenylobacterium sp.]|jgi:hypothetical protein
MSFEQEITQLVQSNDHLTDIVDTKIEAIDARVSAAEAQFNIWKETKHVGFGLTDTLMDHSDPFIRVAPRFSTIEEATAFTFSAADDYAPVDANDAQNKHYTDLNPKVSTDLVWFSHPQPTQFTGRLSVYANISVGLLPHPSPHPINRIAILMSANGAHHQWIQSGAVVDYTAPRVFCYDGTNANRQIIGQSYGVTAYSDLMALHENQVVSLPNGMAAVRIINLGPHEIQVKGFWMIHHGHQKES